MNRIRELRKKARMSGVLVAKRLGISPQFYYEIEKGVRTLTADRAAQIADMFKTTTDYLIGKSEDNLYNVDLAAHSKKDNAPKIGETAFFELSDDEIFNEYNFTFDGKEISNDEAQALIAYLRTLRHLKKGKG